MRYFINELKISVRHAGKKPVTAKAVTVEEIADLQIYSLRIAVANRDLPMLEELWDVFTTWESNHLTRLVDILVNEKWN